MASPSGSPSAWRTAMLSRVARSRGRMWRKGETTGNTLRLVDVADCDPLLVRAHPQGPTRHTGEATCWGHGLGADARARSPSSRRSSHLLRNRSRPLRKSLLGVAAGGRSRRCGGGGVRGSRLRRRRKRASVRWASSPTSSTRSSSSRPLPLDEAAARPHKLPTLPSTHLLRVPPGLQ